MAFLRVRRKNLERSFQPANGVFGAGQRPFNAVASNVDLDGREVSIANHVGVAAEVEVSLSLSVDELLPGVEKIRCEVFGFGAHRMPAIAS
jgi:hypothetical protein